MTNKIRHIDQRGSRLRRCLRLALMLQSPRCRDAKDLARELEVSRRTIFRDLKILGRAGMAIDYDENQRSYYIRGPKAPRKPLPLIEPQELLAVALCVHASPFRTFSTVGCLARRGIGLLLKAQFGPLAGFFPDAVDGFPLPPQLTPDQDLLLLQVFAAIMQERTLKFSYMGQAETLIPRHLRRIDNTWQIRGRTPIHNRNGTFDLELMRDIHFGASQKPSVPFYPFHEFR